MIAAITSGSESNTRAGPVIDGFLRPVILATQPSGARLPRKYREVALRIHRLVERPDDVLVARAAHPGSSRVPPPSCAR